MPMISPGSTGGIGSHAAFGVQMDVSSFVTRCATPEEARALGVGSIVGDLHGGLTFTDDVAAVLEGRSLGGWQEIEISTGERWTIILLNH